MKNDKNYNILQATAATVVCMQPEIDKVTYCQQKHGERKSIAINIANIVIEIGQQQQECCMVILKNGIKSVTHRFFFKDT
jgi:hypothetical protein